MLLFVSVCRPCRHSRDNQMQLSTSSSWCCNSRSAQLNFITLLPCNRLDKHSALLHRKDNIHRGTLWDRHTHTYIYVYILYLQERRSEPLIPPLCYWLVTYPPVHCAELWLSVMALVLCLSISPKGVMGKNLFKLTCSLSQLQVAAR